MISIEQIEYHARRGHLFIWIGCTIYIKSKKIVKNFPENCDGTENLSDKNDSTC